MDIVSYVIGKSSAGGGGDVTVSPLNVSENGVYRAPAGAAYNPVNVNVPSVDIEELYVTENGTYTPLPGKAYGPVNVNVETSAPYTGSYEAESDPFEDTTLDTAGKVMIRDFVIKKITVSKVVNISDGYTVTIGK